MSINKVEESTLSDADSELWESFIDSGLLWLVNMNLHLFGCALAYAKDTTTGRVSLVVPQPVNYTGFSEEINEVGYAKIKQLMKEFTKD